MEKRISSRISEALFNELTEFSKKTGIKKDFFIAKAIEEKIKSEKTKLEEESLKCQ
jgi:predicted DNA-binding protein